MYTRTYSSLLTIICFIANGCSNISNNIPNTPNTDVSLVQNYEKISRIVHIDLEERVATIRFGNDLSNEFLVSRDVNGVQTGVLKGILKVNDSLKTAYILDGTPQINDGIFKASKQQSDSLSKIFRDANT
ncbi:MAG: hypothetical protein CL815_04295 [Coraliomargarita sp.]|nr:hypothetical protein [Coraliomargarita sp.]